MARLVSLWTFAIILLGPSNAGAQTGRPFVELGFGVTGILEFNLGDFGMRAAHPWPEVRVTVPASSRLAVEGTVSTAAERTATSEHRVTYYTVQLRQRVERLSPSSAFEGFVTYGVLGATSRRRSSVYDRTEHSVPGAVALGAGVQRKVGSHLAIRVEGQYLTFFWWPLGTRVTGSISVPIVSY